MMVYMYLIKTQHQREKATPSEYERNSFIENLYFAIEMAQFWISEEEVP